jgi:hypothetical protein
MTWMCNRHSVRRRSGRASLESRFVRAITFDPIDGSRSKFYRIFRRPFSMELMWNRHSVRRKSGRARLE